MDTLLKTFSESPDDPFVLSRVASAVLDHRGKIVAWSHAAEELLGYAHREVIGRSVRRARRYRRPPRCHPGGCGVRSDLRHVRSVACPSA